MELVEFYRSRWTFVWWGAGFLLVAIPIALVINHTTVDINGSTVGANGGVGSVVFPLSGLSIIAMFLAMIFATSAGLSLNRESDTRALSWTKPLSRIGVATRIFAVDAALIVAMYAFAWLVVLAVVAFAHLHAVVDARLWPLSALSLGVALMWYGLVELVTSGLGTNGKGIVGFLWPVALFASALNGQFSGVVRNVLAFVNVFNPLAYSASSVSKGNTSDTFWAFPVEERALVVWVLAVLFCAGATALWIRREA